DPAAGGKPGCSRAWPESTSAGPTGIKREEARRRPGGHAPVRGARHSGRGRPVGFRLVHGALGARRRWMMLFRDRAEAGKQLATKLTQYADRSDVIILGLPRGGVPVAFEVAQALHVPLDVFLVRKLGVPGHEELAMGAIATGGIRVLNEHVIRSIGLSDEQIERGTEEEQHELERREHLYRDNCP